MGSLIEGIAGAVVAYALGSFPTSYLVGKALKGIDIRQHGSGNVGATNVYRVVGKLPGLGVLLVDIAKGWVAAAWLADSATVQALFGFCAVCGHIWSPFLKFQGGKGVATALGVLLGLAPALAIVAVGIWLVTAAVTRYVSVSSITAVTAVPLLMAATAKPLSWVLVSALLCVIIVAKHRANIVRLLRREEPRMGRKVSL